jgi:hypothetical protein
MMVKVLAILVQAAHKKERMKGVDKRKACVWFAVCDEKQERKRAK